MVILRRTTNAMMSEADDTAKKVCDAILAEHAKTAKHLRLREFHKYRVKDTLWVERHHKDTVSRPWHYLWCIPGVIRRRPGKMCM